MFLHQDGIELCFHSPWWCCSFLCFWSFWVYDLDWISDISFHACARCLVWFLTLRTGHFTLIWYVPYVTVTHTMHCQCRHICQCGCHVYICHSFSRMSCQSYVLQLWKSEQKHVIDSCQLPVSACGQTVSNWAVVFIDQPCFHFIFTQPFSSKL